MDEECTKADSMKRDKVYDDVFHHIPSFGNYQKVVYFGTSVLNLLLGPQFGLLVFAMGSPRFQCATPNVTCDVNKCCSNCTSYEFLDGQFTSIVTEVRYRNDKKGYLLVYWNRRWRGEGVSGHLPNFVHRAISLRLGVSEWPTAPKTGYKGLGTRLPLTRICRSAKTKNMEMKTAKEVVNITRESCAV